MNNEFSISALGDSALLISFENTINEEINKKVLAVFNKLKNISLQRITDVVPAYSSLAVYYDAFTIRSTISADQSIYEYVSKEIRKLIEDDQQIILPPSRTIKIPVCYSEKFGMDLKEISSEKNISVNEIIHLHTSKKYRVYMIGFLPGFPYMGEVDEKIAVPRMQQPRTFIEAGSVGIAGKQTGIYPLNSPGGWQIIGKTPIRLFEKEKAEPVLFNPGDEVEFFTITKDEFENYQSRNT